MQESTSPETTTPETTWTTLDLARRIATLADERQAERTVILHVEEDIRVTDYFVITEGLNKRHLNAIAAHVVKELKKDGVHRMGGSSMDDQQWVLLDFGSVVLHVFSREAREFYDLDNLWGDCPRVPLVAE